MSVISVSGLCKSYPVFRSSLQQLGYVLMPSHIRPLRMAEALRNISFQVDKGETLGIVGRNGSGKSTLLQIICGTLRASGGTAIVDGRISALLELGAGFNPEFTGRENIFLNAAILGLSREETMARYDEIVRFSGLDTHHLEQPVKTYSSGMYVRLAFSVAVAVEPDILIVDEALAVGDEAFQRKCYARIRDMQARGATLLFVSHSAGAVVELCDRALLLDAGELLLDASPKQVIESYQKLIYSPPEKQQDLREALRKEGIGALSSYHNIGQYSADEAQAQGIRFDPGLIPETYNAYPSKGAVIEQPRIESLQGEPVNMLTSGERYQFVYSVRFEREAHKVRFGMNIKTKEGIEMAGAGTSSLNDTIDHIAQGATYQVRFTFTCNLREGLYFINCGCFARQGDEFTFLHRIIDSCAFRVLPDYQPALAGKVHMELESEVSLA